MQQALTRSRARAASVTRPAAPTAAPTRAEAHTYGAPLAVAYLLTPALAIAGGVGAFEATESIAVGIAAGSLLLAPPAGVHAYNGSAERALGSFGTLVGITLGSAAALGGFVYLLASATCDSSAPEHEAEGCDWVVFAPTLIGAGAGAIIGYVSYAVYDVVNGASVRAPGAGEARNDRELSLWLTPLSSPFGERRPSLPVRGFQAGATLAF